MKKIMDKLFNNVKFDKRYILFSLVIVILGVITGALFTVILNSADKKIVIEYIEEFINKTVNNTISYKDLIKNTLLNNFITIFIICIIGFTYFFFWLNILILFYKSFVIGFSISGFILTYKLKGILLSIIYVFPHLIINILLISILTAFTIKLSLNMINNIIKKKEVNMRLYFNKYLYVTLLFIILISLTSIYEAFVPLYLIKLISNIL